MTKTPKKNKKKKQEPTVVEPTEQAVRPRAVLDPFERFGLGELTHWPSWFDRAWPERFFRDFDDMAPVGIKGIKVEEFTDGDQLVVRGELPGVEPDDITVEVDKGRLSIRAKRESRVESEEGGYRSEFRYGSFARVVTLPEGASADDIEASYTDGILEVRVKVEAETQPETKKIDVKRS